MLFNLLSRTNICALEPSACIPLSCALMLQSFCPQLRQCGFYVLNLVLTLYRDHKTRRQNAYPRPLYLCILETAKAFWRQGPRCTANPANPTRIKSHCHSGTFCASPYTHTPNTPPPRVSMAARRVERASIFETFANIDLHTHTFASSVRVLPSVTRMRAPTSRPARAHTHTHTRT